MSNSFLWAIDFYGSLFKLALETQEWSRNAVNNPDSRENTFKRISSAANCAWAIGGDQNTYVSVFETDLPIRVQVGCYENERWSMTYGWSSKSRFFTDRSNWSSKDGKTESPKDSFKLPSSGWVWQGDWHIDEATECDINGWQYAVDFPAKYYKKPGRLMFARRRKWVRMREFVTFNTWIMIPPYSKSDPFQDISIGGHNLPGQLDGFLSVWAITFSGKVLFRSGVTRSCAEGERWLEVSTDELSLVQISIGPSGTSWDIVPPPCQDPLHTVAVGNKSIWSLSKRAKVYFWRGSSNEISSTSSHDSRSSISSSSSYWVEMVGLFSGIDIGPNDQVWAIDQEMQQLQFRTNVTEDEPSGHEWKRFTLIGKLGENAPTHLCCVSSGTCDIDATYFDNIACKLVSRGSCTSLNLLSSCEDFSWRNDILKCLCDRNNKLLESSKFLRTFPEGTTSPDCNKRGECLYLLDKYYDTWCKCHLKFQMDHSQGYSQPVLFAYYMKKKNSFEEMVLSLREITCIHRLNTSKRHSFAIETWQDDHTVVLSMESEALVNEWLTALNPHERCEIKDEYITLWATTEMCDIFQCNMSESGFSAPDYKWMPVSGHLRTVVCGGNGVTWGIGCSGKPYVYIGNITNKKNLNQQDVEDKYIYENQRWNPVEGYADRLLMSDRWNWSDKTGVYKRFKEDYVLPLSYKWVGDWVIDYHKADQNGWRYAIDFPRSYHKNRGINDYVRRRRWKRSCIVSWSGPWMEVKTDVKLCDVSIDMDSKKETLCCWVVTCKGDVMVRNGVTAECPQGTSWTYIETDTSVVSISAGAESRVWCVRKDGSCYLRAGFQSNKEIGTHWFHVLKEEILMNHIYAGHNFILALDKIGGLYLRSSVTATYPEGTAWEPVLNNVTEVSVNSRDEVYLIQDNDLKVWANVQSGRFETCHLTTLLKGVWTGISCRSVSFPEIQPAKCIDRSNSVKASEDTTDGGGESSASNTTQPPKITDPYSIDIYSFYNETPVDLDSLFDDATC